MDNLCPVCGSARVVKITPTVPGPNGWGGRCKDCGSRWDDDLPPDEFDPIDPRRPQWWVEATRGEPR
jgi:DNA-directed RNA polymerase subunit RPC12/RpoP